MGSSYIASNATPLTSSSSRRPFSCRDPSLSPFLSLRHPLSLSASSSSPSARPPSPRPACCCSARSRPPSYSVGPGRPCHSSEADCPSCPDRRDLGEKKRRARRVRRGRGSGRRRRTRALGRHGIEKRWRVRDRRFGGVGVGKRIGKFVDWEERRRLGLTVAKGQLVSERRRKGGRRASVPCSGPSSKHRKKRGSPQNHSRPHSSQPS